MNELPVVFRRLQKDDFSESQRFDIPAFIVNSWVQTSRYNSAVHCWIPRYIHIKYMTQTVRFLVEHCPELFELACREDDPDQIFGWACIDKRAVHFAFVKEDFRRLGIANHLTGKQRTVSAWSNDCDRIKGLIYRPSFFRKLLLEKGYFSQFAKEQKDGQGNQIEKRATDKPGEVRAQT